METDEDSADFLDEEEDDDFFDDGMDSGIKNQVDPQILKLQDRIKFFRHRCVASLGNNLYERAYEFLKENNSEGATAEDNREGLLQILGEDWIGFWAILDQILFYETMVDELSTINDDISSNEESDDGNVKRKNIGNVNLDVRNGGALNSDSDLEL